MIVFKRFKIVTKVIQIIKLVWAGEYVRNISKLMLGIFNAQAITYASMPIITRLFTPEEFGVLGLFTALTAILIPGSALTYPKSIILIPMISHKLIMAKICILIGLLIALLSSLLCYFYIKILDNLSINTGVFLACIFLTLFSASIYQVSQSLLQSYSRYSILASSTIKQSLTINTLKVLAGMGGAGSASLVIITSLGYIFHLIYQIFSLRKNVFNYFDFVISNKNFYYTSYQKKRSYVILRKYKDFPIFRAPAIMINATSRNAPMICIAALNDPAIVGYYLLALKMVNTPINLVSRAVSDVLYPALAKNKCSKNKLRTLVIKNTSWLILLSIIPYSILGMVSPGLFGYVFGENWVIAGQFSRWLCIWMFFSFISRPAGVLIPVIGLQKWLLKFEIASSAIKIGILSVALILYKDALMAVAAASIAAACTYVYLIYYVLTKTAVGDN